MSVYRTDIPPHVAEVIRHLPPEVKSAVKSAIRLLCGDPFRGEPLQRDLAGLWKYRVRRFRLIYQLDRKARVLRLVALGHRRSIYDELSALAKTGR
ncbi:MAG: type II toxin-antitoxin system RelE/ParE family toxin [Burkholderiales bacterium]|jgi:mRNA interferase RelE/StbE